MPHPVLHVDRKLCIETVGVVLTVIPLVVMYAASVATLEGQLHVTLSFRFLQVPPQRIGQLRHKTIVHLAYLRGRLDGGT